MSALIVEVARINQVSPHPNADRLDVGIIKGWQVVLPKGKYAPGDKVVYIPPDSVMPTELSDKLGVTKYLSNGRVRCAKLRGEPSFGIVMDPDDDWFVGTDVASHYGITKYIPPLRTTAGDAESPHPLFTGYTEIENMRHFPTVIAEGEEVSVSEKIHGSSCRVGLIEGERMAGSKGVRRKHPSDDTDIQKNLYWHPWAMDSVNGLMTSFLRRKRQVILFGEVYGKVQSLRYGLPNGIAFRAFDLMVDGKYLDNPEFFALCEKFDVPMVPILYRGPFSLDYIKKLAEGPSTIPDANHIREGVVVKPTKERVDPRVGRVILKYVGDGYLLGDQSDTTDE